MNTLPAHTKTPVDERRLAEDAVRIREIGTRLTHSREAARGELLRIGELLHVWREALPHGRYEAWVRGVCGLHVRTARRAVALHRAYLGLPPLHAIRTITKPSDKLSDLKSRGGLHAIPTKAVPVDTVSTLNGQGRPAWVSDGDNLHAIRTKTVPVDTVSTLGDLPEDDLDAELASVGREPLRIAFDGEEEDEAWGDDDLDADEDFSTAHDDESWPDSDEVTQNTTPMLRVSGGAGADARSREAASAPAGGRVRASGGGGGGGMQMTLETVYAEAGARVRSVAARIERGDFTADQVSRIERAIDAEIGGGE